MQTRHELSLSKTFTRGIFPASAKCLARDMKSIYTNFFVFNAKKRSPFGLVKFQKCCRFLYHNGGPVIIYISKNWSKFINSRDEWNGGHVDTASSTPPYVARERLLISSSSLNLPVRLEGGEAGLLVQLEGGATVLSVGQIEGVAGCTTSRAHSTLIP